MVKLRHNLIKMFSLVFAVCAAFAIATMPSAKTASAAEEASFKANESSILVYDGEDEGKIGLRFEAEFNTAWLNANTADKYTFGMVVAPTANFTAWDGEATPTANMEAVDGVNIIRIQNTALTAGQAFGASILFDDASLKATIAEKLEIEVSEVTDEQLSALKEEVYVQSYSAVPYATYGEEIVYLNRVDSSMREAAISTLASAIIEQDFEAIMFAFNYIGITEDDMHLQKGYVANNVLTVDSAEGFEIKESDAILVGGKVLALGVDYTIENGVVTFAEVDKTQPGIYVVTDTALIGIELTYADAVLATADDVVDFFTNKDKWSYKESTKTYTNSSNAVLANDIDMSEELVSNFDAVNFTGIFDGRGHVLSNVTVDTKDEANSDKSTYGFIGSIGSTGIIRNVAFSDIKAVDHFANGAVLGYKFEGLMENVYVSYSVDNKSYSGMFVLAETGIMKNMVVVDNYYDPSFDIEKYVDDHKTEWGISPISRSYSDKTATYDNVQVVSQRPLAYVSTSTNLDVTYTGPVVDNPETEKDETAAAKINWGARFAYAENETDIWYEFDYFYREAGVNEYGLPTGLGLEAGTATVANTSETGKTLVKQGIRRYDDMEALYTDENNAYNIQNLIYTGFWKVVDNAIVWANDESISAPCTFVNEVDYDASTGIIYTTAWNGENVNKITLNGVVLTAEENGGLVLDNEQNIVGVRAKVNASDEIVGINYRDNKTGSSNVIKYDGNIRVYTDDQIYVIRNLNYYTQLIFDATDLREAVGYNVDYSIATVGTEDATTEREQKINGKGFFVGTTKDGSNYYEGVYNAGIYKMMNSVDMYYVDTENAENSTATGIGYTNNPLVSGSRIGGFVGYFDGNGYAIQNYKADEQGLFGRASAYVTGNEVDSGKNLRYFTYNPTIKNLAITDVITSYYDTDNFYATPILANTLGTDAYAATQSYVTIENIYVTVSTTASTALGNFVLHLGGNVKMNNVYIENNNEFDMVEVDGLVYTMTGDDTRPVVQNGTKVWNVMKNWKDAREGVLFGWAYSASSKAPNVGDYIATETLDNTTNVYVVSTMPINYASRSSLFVYPSFAKYTGVVASAENGLALPRADFYKLGKVNPNGTYVYVAVAYASNETVGNVLVPYAFKQSAIDDAKYILSSTEAGGLGLTTLGDYGGTAFMCNKCGAIAHSVTGRTVEKNNTCLVEECDGKYVSVNNYKFKNGSGKTGAGIYASPCMYEFTVHSASELGAYYSHENGAYKLAGVKKYASVEAMTNAKNDYSSFTGAAGNGMWKVVETETTTELVWVGRAA